MNGFTEGSGRRLQFAADLQQVAAATLRRPTSIRYMRRLSGNATLAEESRDLHDKFTASHKGCRPAFAFRRHFRHMCREMPFSRPVRHGMVMEQVSKQFSS
ncbi:hypothetical protein [Mesorhizobium sp.]|uniref:hypothetical protein n=1 Tax=Mesorhizobium sp. TaxID=1871066 RepID=UPI0025E71FAF|nr:hypothetical protein [Mesorhizobium sp.]